MAISSADVWAWVGVIIVGIVWYIIRRGRQVRLKEEETKAVIVQKVMSAYGSFLEKVPLSPTEIRDEKELPFPKQIIKNAAFEVLINTRGNSNFLNAVESGLLLLAQFQPDVGAPMDSVVARIISETPPDRVGKMSNDELMELAKKMGSSVNDSRYETSNTKVEAERNNLLAEIRKYRR